jgi:hypothetical protein
MDRRELLKASLAGAAAMGIAAPRGTEAEIAPQAIDDGAAMDAHGNPSAPLVSVYDFEAAAKRKLSIPAWEYFNGGSGDEITLRRNRTALDALQLKPRVLVDVTHIDTGRMLLGQSMEHPILLAPTSSHLLAHPDAEVATARGAAAVVAALSRHIRKLPVSLRRSLTWDRGHEMAQHKTFSVATDVKVYFCDPHSPWQRGTNENTNRLLRQYLPKKMDLSPYTQSELDKIALRLNQRPRKTLEFQTPAS